LTNWIGQQLKSKLFRKLFLSTFATTILPLLVMTFFWLQSKGHTTVTLFPEFFSVVFLALLLAGIVAFFLSKNITSPISDLTKSATEIARGNFQHEIKVDSEDEIGRLGRLFNYMTTELRRLDKMNLAKIIAERNKTQTIIKNIADGVIVTDPESRILILNAAAESWFNLSQEKAFDQPLSGLIKENALLQLIQDAIQDKQSALSSTEIPLKKRGDWKPRILQAKAARVQQESGDLIGIVTILRDITQQKEIDKLKTELVSMVAHELRSPLTSISGFSELMLDSDVTRKQASEYATIILNESNRLSELINKFLDISRIESGRIQPKMAELDLPDTVHMVVGNNSYLADKKNIKVEVHAPEGLSHVWADGGMMEQVILNLFSNAVKYSPENKRIDLVLKQNESELVVEVHDQGYGIPAKALPRIFEKFYRVTDNEEVRNQTGTGLGLAMVKQIIDLHGGRVEVESEENRGSVFSVYLPKLTTKSRAGASYSEDVDHIIR
jgi:PAS domain S-box-containing protein